MEKEDLKFLMEVFEGMQLLFYGDLEETFDTFLSEVFEHDFRDYGFKDVEKDDNFMTAYWLFISLLDANGMYEYGTSPRGGWLTEKGKRFKKIITENPNWIGYYHEYEDEIYSN